MEPRILEAYKNLPREVHFLYGGKSWVENKIGFRVVEALAEKDQKIRTSVHVIENATHHLQCTHPSQVNQIINNILDKK